MHCRMSPSCFMARVSSVSLFLTTPNTRAPFYGGTTELQQAYADIAQADLNGDGLPDLVVVSSQSATVLLNDPSHPGSFVAQTPIPLVNGAYGVQIADLNQDGMPDIRAFHVKLRI